MGTPYSTLIENRSGCLDFELNTIGIALKLLFYFKRESNCFIGDDGIDGNVDID